CGTLARWEGLILATVRLDGWTRSAPPSVVWTEEADLDVEQVGNVGFGLGGDQQSVGGLGGDGGDQAMGAARVSCPVDVGQQGGEVRAATAGV
ncbi:MAG: hypothetical protein ACRDRV_21470, partial [Pseudonocardiaceae bacterium]